MANYDVAIGALAEFDYATALRELRPLAEQGHVASMALLGEMYEKGLGTSQNYSEAARWYSQIANAGVADYQFKIALMIIAGQGFSADAATRATSAIWLRKAAEQGHVVAQRCLGQMHTTGDGVPHDYVKAVAWNRKAAEQGDSEAQFNLGCLYVDGNGVSRDLKQAVAWYRRAAKQNHAPSQLNLGILYGRGEGVPRDDVQSYMWFGLAAAQGDEKARELQHGLRSRMTRKQIAEAQALSRELDSCIGQH